MSKLRIGYISDQYLPRTSTDTEQITSMISAFGLNGNDVTLVIPIKYISDNHTAQRLAEYYAVEKSFKVSEHKVTIPLFRGFVKLWHALKMACFEESDTDFDVIYTRNLPVVLAYVLFSDQPVVYETYRNWPDQNKLLIPFFRVLNSSSNFLGIVTHSQLALKSYENMGISNDKLLVAHNGIWPERFYNSPASKKARDKLNVRNNGLIATYAGRVNTDKGLSTVLKMAEFFPEVTFWIVGSEQNGKIEEHSRNISNVTVFPWQPIKELPTYLFASDILIIPPSSKPLLDVGNTVLPMKTFIYMASQKAIFAPKNPDIEEVLENMRNAVLVEPDNMEEIREKFRMLVESADLRKRIGRRAYKDVINVSWEKRAGKIEQFIKEKLQ